MSLLSLVTLVQRRLSQRTLSLETARLLATVMLVSYHVIGSTAQSGLELGYPHPARLFADFFRDLRMPVFAFIAGAVFALKPVSVRELPRFALGKLRRLLVPGAVAVTLTALISDELLHEHGLEHWWHYLIYPYLHYWFLMSILLIFLIYAPIDAISRGTAAWPAFLFALFLSYTDVEATPNVLSVNGAIYLAPYFLFGVLFWRNARNLSPYAVPVLIVSCLAVMIGTIANLHELLSLGRFDANRQDSTSLAFGLSACVILTLVLPRLAIFDEFGTFSFSIYLYHVFATSAMRRCLHAIEVHDVGLHIFCGLVAGLGVPILLHLLVRRYPLPSAIVLGLRPRGSARALAISQATALEQSGTR